MSTRTRTHPYLHIELREGGYLPEGGVRIADDCGGRGGFAREQVAHLHQLRLVHLQSGVCGGGCRVMVMRARRGERRHRRYI